MKVRHPYFLTRCEHCGWQGSSEECGLISYGDDADVTCPKCERTFCADEIDEGGERGGEDGNRYTQLLPLSDLIGP